MIYLERISAAEVVSCISPMHQLHLKICILRWLPPLSFLLLWFVTFDAVLFQRRPYLENKDCSEINLTNGSKIIWSFSIKNWIFMSILTNSWCLFALYIITKTCFIKVYDADQYLKAKMPKSINFEIEIVVKLISERPLRNIFFWH